MNMKFSALLLCAGLACASFALTGHAATQGAPPNTPSAGKQVFDRWCAACHSPGPRFPGTASLAVKYGNSMPAALEERTNLTPEVVAYFVRNGVLTMPHFRKTEISDAELQALGEYLSKSKLR